MWGRTLKQPIGERTGGLASKDRVFDQRHTVWCRLAHTAAATTDVIQ